jgi:hypothetical protein
MDYDRVNQRQGSKPNGGDAQRLRSREPGAEGGRPNASDLQASSRRLIESTLVGVRVRFGTWNLAHVTAARKLGEAGRE